MGVASLSRSKYRYPAILTIFFTSNKSIAGNKSESYKRLAGDISYIHSNSFLSAKETIVEHIVTVSL